MPKRFSTQSGVSTTRDQDRNASTVPDIEIDPVELGRSFIKRRRMIAISVSAAMAITAVIMLLLPNQYTSQASILPSGSRNELSGLMDLAGTFGLNATGGGTAENSSALYPSILRSNHVVDAVLDRDYPPVREGQDGPTRLDVYFDQDDPNELRAALREVTSVSTHKKLGIVSVKVQTEYPHLSQDVLIAYLEELEDYLNVKRKTHARQSVVYLTDQIAQRSAELTDSEDRLREFMLANRNWHTSTDPDLQTNMARLRRDVTIKTTTYQLLSEQLELARLEAQKSIPIVRILDDPSLPTFKSGPRRTITVIFAGLSTLLLLATWLFLKHLMIQGDDKGRLHVLRDEFCDAFPRSSRVLRIRRAAETPKHVPAEQEVPV